MGAVFVPSRCHSTVIRSTPLDTWHFIFNSLSARSDERNSVHTKWQHNAASISSLLSPTQKFSMNCSGLSAYQTRLVVFEDVYSLDQPEFLTRPALAAILVFSKTARYDANIGRQLWKPHAPFTLAVATASQLCGSSGPSTMHVGSMLSCTPSATVKRSDLQVRTEVPQYFL